MAEMMNGADATNATDNGAESAVTDLTALQAELAKMKAENEKLKNAQSNASADASKYKKELAARMSEQERAAAETKEFIEQLKAENEALKRSQALAEHEAGFVGAGFESEIAKKAAEAFYDKDFKTFMGSLSEFITAHDKAINAEAIRNTPRPGVGSTGTTSITKEQFDKMNYTEKLKLFTEQPDLYKELNKE